MKNLTVVIQGRIFDRSGGPSLGHRFEMDACDADGISLKNRKRDFWRYWDKFSKKMEMTFLHGWFLDDKGIELHCLYCNRRTQGFCGGRRRTEELHLLSDDMDFKNIILPGSFLPNEDPCPCRL